MGFFKNLFQDMIDACLPLPEEEDMPEDPAPVELRDAEERVPQSTFVQSCRAFYEKRGFLSNAQKRALTSAGKPNRYNRAEQDEDNPFDSDR